MKRCFEIKKQREQRGKKGFTLMEVLVTIAIIAVLSGVVMMAALNIKKNMEQKRLDTIAQDIYVAAQNQLTGLYTDSRINFLNPDTAPAGLSGDLFKVADESGTGGADNTPSDWDAASAGAFVPMTALDNFSADAVTERSFAILMPEGILSQEVYDKYWIIEYNADYGYVYAVYYTEDPSNFNPASATVSGWYGDNGEGESFANHYRTYRKRKGSGIGYYGGGGVLGNKVQLSNTSLNATINVENAEELKATITVKVPTEFKDNTVQLTYTLKGMSSNQEYQQVVYLDTSAGYFTREQALTIDSLKPGVGFRELFCEGTHNFMPGEDLELSVLAELGERSGATFTASDADTASAAVTFNSLFESLTTDAGGISTATVAYGRHLQNLQEIVADPSLQITGAVQTRNIDFSYTTPEDDTDALQWWAETYADTDPSGNVTVWQFAPLDNANIKTYDGGNYTITALTTEGAINAGLFGTFYGDSIQNTKIVGAKVKGTNAAGALIGTATGDVTLKNCGAYLERSHYYGYTYNSIPYRISGSNYAGGLVGVAEGDVTADLCFASAVIGTSTTTQTGGLLGKVGGKMTLTHSYGDCYIFGRTIGGLAGSCFAASEISGCYSAGFTANNDATVTAGFVPGAVSGISNSYTIFNLGSDYVGAQKIATVRSGSTDDTYYIGENISAENYPNSTRTEKGTSVSYSGLRSVALKAGNSSDVKLETDDGFSFEANTTRTTAYNLAEGLGLTVYPYPVIEVTDAEGTVTDLRHYGDWDGSAFDPGTLVYFEEYETTDTSGKTETIRGYYGAGSNYLRDDLQVVRDGYALIYLGDDEDLAKNDTTVAEFKNKNITIEKATGDDLYTVTTKAFNGAVREAEYYFRDLPYDSIVNSEEAVNASFYSKISVKRTEKDTSVEITSYYYFNPLFADTVVQVDTEDAEAPTLKDSASYTITVRTARQLNLMSEYFGKLDKGYLEGRESVSSKIVYEQELDLDYTKYQWTKAGYDKAVTEQVPIAETNKVPFYSTYDGMYHQITGVHLKSETLFAGLFGCNAGRLRNIVVAAEAASKYIVGYSVSPNRANSTAYAGALAGYNVGTVSNCAVAGYRMEAYTYNSTTLNAGGLVGYNNGTITACSVDVPSLKAETNKSNGSLAVFAGINGGSGVINYSYAVGALSARRYTSGTVYVAGFTGRNSGTIRNSYTASAMTVSNIESRYLDAFAPNGGMVRNCYYLNDGSYKYCGDVYAYNQSSKTAAGITYDKLKNSSSSLPRFAAAENSYYNGSTTKNGGVTNYPFLTSIKNKEGKAVHYGDWPSTDIFGEYGMLYWEHEEKGANNGYHFYLVDLKGEVFSTLCEAHDDGGVITEYGYGYYSLKEKSPVVNINNANRGGTNTAAEQDLAAQFADAYKFTLYTTMDAFSSSASGMYLNGTSSYAQLSLACDENNLNYYFSPFFAAAISTKESDFPAGVKLQVRSIDQLQFINWNNNSKRNSDLVTSGNYKNYTYLAYTSSTGTAKQTKQGANNQRALNTSWLQSHDIDMSGKGKLKFTPIAGAATSSNNEKYNAVLYTWFGGVFDGQSYKIQELTMESDAFTVGLFGVTAGAQIENMIMYSEEGAKISRVTTNSDKLGSYALGGLIGVAYDYNTSSGRSITNCAIAGYKIIDDSKNQQAKGEANVGGLIGVANVSLENCSAVTDIEINCTHKDSNNKITLGAWGNFVRVGGVTGATMGTLKNCYSGGSISAGKDTLDENYDNNGNHVNTNERNKTVKSNKSTNLYVAGIAGSGFAMNYKNFTNNDSLKEGSPNFENCYTYITFPRLEGTIRSIAVIGSLADRYYAGIENGQKVTIKNCYYLSAIIDKSVMLDNVPTFKNGDNESNGSLSMISVVNQYFDAMLQGSSAYANILYGHSARTGLTLDVLQPKTFSEMTSLASTLGPDWGYVTTDENGSAIDGKYSFPAGVANLEGLNYPFPTIVTQPDNTFNRTVNVHYGEWPKENGIYASAANVRLDLLTVGGDAMDVTLTCYEDYKEIKIGSLNGLKLSYIEGEDNTTPSDVSEIVKVTPTVTGSGTINLFIQGLTEGSVTIQVEYNSGNMQHFATIQVTVTADFSITAELVQITADAAGAETITALPEDTALETFQGDNICWRLQAYNGAEEPILLEPQNWSVISGYDENYDSYTIRKIGTDVVLEMASNQIGSHTIQVMASNLAGVSSGIDGLVQTVTGTRNVELTFEVFKNPPTVEIYKDPYGTTDNTLLGVLYMGADGCYTDKKCTMMATALSKEWFKDRTGYTFGGFSFVFEGNTVPFAEYDAQNPGLYLDTDGNLIISYNNVIASGFGVNEDIKVYADWKANEYQLTLSYNGQTKSYTVTYGSPVALEGYSASDYPDNEGYVFGWYDKTDADGVVILSRNGTFTPVATEKGYLTDGKWSMAQDVTLYGQVKEVEYTLKLDPNYPGTTAETKTFKYSDPGIDLGGQTPVRTGYTFDGWFTAANGGEKVEGTVKRDTAVNGSPLYDLNNGILDVTLYAHWTANTYTVTYNANCTDAAGTMADQSFTYDVAQNLSANTFSRTGYEFTGWNTAANGSGTSYADGESVKNLTENNGATVTLYAQWAKWYTITYLAEDGSEYTGLKQQYLETVDSVTLAGEPADKPAGGTFVGWKAVLAAGTWVNDKVYSAGEKVNKPVSGDVTLQAVWSYYKLRLMSRGQLYKEYDSANIKSQSNLDSVGYTAPTRDGGWTLDGWYMKSKNTKVLDAGGKIVAGNEADITSGGVFDLKKDVELTARWKRNKDIYVLSNLVNGAPSGGAKVLLVNSQNNPAYALANNNGSIDTVSVSETENGWTDINGNSINGYYVDDTSTCTWTVGKSGQQYSFRNSNRYIGRNNANSNLSLVNSSNNRGLWNYGDNSYYYSVRSGWNVYYYSIGIDTNGDPQLNEQSVWYGTPSDEIYLYTVSEQEVYSYD